MREEYEHLRQEAASSEQALARLAEIISILRKQCPWDRAQTHETLKACMLEEAYESVEAIDRRDADNLAEELGDVMLQVVFHSNLAQEEGLFDLKTVINRECEKMIRRHPHIFLTETANNTIKSIDNVLEKWENIKERENAGKTRTDRLAGVPLALPALTRAAKVQKKAAEVGFDWTEVTPAVDKVREETEELIAAYSAAEPDKERVAEELGDLLFSVVNVARFLKVDPEEALRMTTNKFIRRFSHVEQQALACGRSVEDMSLAEMDKLWDEAKELEQMTDQQKTFKEEF